MVREFYGILREVMGKARGSFAGLPEPQQCWMVSVDDFNEMTAVLPETTINETAFQHAQCPDSDVESEPDDEPDRPDTDDDFEPDFGGSEEETDEDDPTILAFGLEFRQASLISGPAEHRVFHVLCLRAARRIQDSSQSHKCGHLSNPATGAWCFSALEFSAAVDRECTCRWIAGRVAPL